MQIFTKILLICLFVTGIAKAQLPSELPDSSFQCPDGPVYAVAADNSHIYLGGSFNYVGRYVGGSILADSTSGSINNNVPKMDGSVWASYPDGEGGLFVGGSFKFVGKEPRAGLARLNTNGTLNMSFDFQTNVGGEVYNLYLDGDTLYVGGKFNAINGVTRNNAASINIRTGQLTAWNPSPSEVVNCIRVHQNQVFIGGSFTEIGGQPIARLASVTKSTGSVNNWTPAPSNSILWMEVYQDRLFVTGSFTTIAGITRNRLASFDLPTNSLTNWNPNLNSSGWAMAIYGNTLFLGGAFTNSGGTQRQNIAQYDLTTGNLTSFNTTVGGTVVISLKISGNRLYVGGTITSLGGQTRTSVGVLNANTAATISWTTEQITGVWTLNTLGTRIFIGGQFKVTSTTLRRNLAIISRSTKAATFFAPNPNGIVRALESYVSELYVGGDFTSIAGVTRNRLARLNIGNSTLSTTFNPDVNGPVHSLLLNGSVNTLYVGGDFSSVGGTTRNNLAAVATADGAVEALDPNVNGIVRAFCTSGNNLYFGGDFTTVGGVTRNRLAMVDVTSGALNSFNPSPDQTVRSIIRDISQLYVGGDFTTIASNTRRGLAVFSLSNNSLVTGFNANLNGNVYTLLTQNNLLYLGGDFTTIGGTSRPFLGAVLPTTGVVRLWNPIANGLARSLKIGINTVSIGGEFSTLGNNATFGSGHVAVSACLDKPTITASGPLTFCQPGSVTLSAPAGFSYQWLQNGIVIQSGANRTLVVSVTRSNVTVRTIANGCTSALSDPVNVEVKPWATSSVSTSALCYGVPFSMPVSNDIPGTIINWTRVANVNISTPVASATGVTNIAETLTSTNNVATTVSYSFTSITPDGCQRNNSISILISPTPSLTSATNAGIICSGSLFTYTPTASVTGSTFSWTRAAVAGISNEAVTSPVTGNISETLINTTSSNVTVVYQVTSTRSGCSSTTDVSVVVKPNLTPTITAGSSTTFCSGSSVVLSAPAGFGYLWSNGATTRDITVSTAGSYTVRTITNGCTSAVSNTIIVTVNTTPATPSITTSGSTDVCLGNNAVLSAPAGFDYLWSSGETTQDITVNTAGTYTVRTIANGCTSEVSNPVVINIINPSAPSTTPTGAVTINSGTSTTIAASGGSSYIWSTGETSSSISVNSAGSYTVRQIVNGCTSAASAAVEVSVITPPSITTFSPNGGPIGTVVTLTGANLNNVTAVRIGSIAGSFTIVNATTITFTIPASSVSAPITLVFATGEVNTTTNFVIFTPPAFCATAINNGFLNISEASQSVIGAADGIHYWAFQAAASETFVFSTCGASNNTFIRIYNSTGGILNSFNDNGILCTGIAASGRSTPIAPGTYYVVLSNNSCVNLTANTTLTFYKEATSITAVSPNSGLVGSTTVLSGVNLNMVNTISVNGTPANITSKTGNSLTMVIGSGTTSGPISFTTVGGNSSTSTLWYYISESICTPPSTAYLGRIGNFAYYQSTSSTTIANARLQANARGGRLVTVNSAAIQNLLFTELSRTPANLSRTFWIGYTDEVTEGSFVWDSGLPDNYNNWNAGEPNDAGTGEDYATISMPSGVWNDLPNTSNAFYIMEIPIAGLTISGNNAICPGGTTTLTFSGGTGTYQLSSNGGTSWSNVSGNTATVGVGTYTTRGVINGCTTVVSSPFVVTETPPSISVSTDGCGTVSLTASGPGVYNWSTGVTGPTITVTETGMYSVGHGGCSSSRFVRVQKPEAITLSPTTILCAGQTATLTTGLSTGEVFNLAGLANNAGLVNGNGNSARFSSPCAITMGADAQYYVADYNNNCIRRVNKATGEVTVFAGSSTGIAGFTNGTGTGATLSLPLDLAMDSKGNLFVTEAGNNCIRRITPTGVVTTLAGNGNQGSADGTGTEASFTRPYGIAVDAQDNLYVTEEAARRIRRITPTGVVSTILLTGSLPSGSLIWGIEVNAEGTLFHVVCSDNTVKAITSSGAVTTYAGIPGTAGSTSGNLSLATLNSGRGMSRDKLGNLYLADYGANMIRKITPDGITTVAGTGTFSSTTGSISTATLAQPHDVFVDDDGNLALVEIAASTVKIIKLPAATSWSNGLSGVAPIISSSGTYSLTTTNTHGCVSSATTVVTQYALPAAPTFSIAGGESCVGNTIAITNAASCPTCTFTWGHGATGSTTAVLLGTNIYTATTTSAEGCSAPAVANVTINGLANGTWLGSSAEWSTGSNWCGGQPVAGANVTIRASTTNQPNIGNSNVLLGNVELTGGATISIGSGGVLSTTGNLSGTGNITGNCGATLRLSGSATQSISVPVSIGDLQVDNIAGANLSSHVFVCNSLTLNTGNLNTTGGHLTLLPSVTAVTESATGRIVGTVTARGRAVGTGSLSMLGISIGSGADDLDTVFVQRRDEAGTFQSNSGIGHVWSIRAHRQPSAGRMLTLNWAPVMQNGKLFNTMQVWRRADGSNEWNKVGQVQNRQSAASAPSITVNTTSFSDWTVSDANNPLPVTLLSFTGSREGGRVNLSWFTASEQQNRGFMVQRSTDGISFDSIGWETGAGNSSIKRSYAFTDYFTERAYYRLAQHDMDGSVHTSPMVFVGSSKNELTVFPNPTDGQVSILGLSPTWTAYEVRNLTGQVVLHGQLNDKFTNLNLSALPAGLYHCHVAGVVLRVTKR